MHNKHELPKLKYEYNSLEPFIDARTMEIHYSKHHQTYVDRLNATLEKYPELQKKAVEDLLKNLDSVPEEIRTQVKNHGGGHFNHSFFWALLKLGTNLENNKEVEEAIKNKFGNYEKFKEEFSKAALNQFGSGWAWLVLNKNKELEIIQTSNQDSPISQGKIPLLTIDVWEHAYYLKYQNKRADYVEAFFNVINWDKVNELFKNL
jgi:Fe-Mn family superoxide dismutase